ncbi:MAG: ferredoxin--NADP(+) reductase [Gammaproteobacteria bacterium]|nr:ferredoxin--NADP(+) reductase [Gammaproteobacteria bacterium]
MKDWIKGEVVENIHWTENLFTLRVNADVNIFTAGQFTSLALDIDGERIARPYSYLSAPDERPVEFFFYTATGGKLSNALVKLESGDHLWIKQNANGFFTLNEVPNSRDLWMMGTGTGIAPFLSILKTKEPWDRFENIVLVHAVRTSADLRYLEIVQQLQQEYKNRFIFQAFVSRESVEDTLPGRIPPAIADGSLEQAARLKLDITRSQVMLCGNPDMVKDTMEILASRGLKKNRRRTPGQVTVENYW